MDKKIEEAKEYASMNKNTGSEVIRDVIKHSGKPMWEVADLLGIKAQSFSTKLYRNTFTYTEVVTILHLLGYEIKFIDSNK